MSTRCNIIITSRYRKPVYLYHHHDGYPEGVGVQLRKVLAERNRFWWFIQPLVNGLIKDKFGLNDKEYEFTTGLHSDIEFCYVINTKAHTLRCYSIGYEKEPKEYLNRHRLVDIPVWDGTPTMYENQ